eukprot:1161810-Pelagomonas_calceolata.AAC.14
MLNGSGPTYMLPMRNAPKYAEANWTKIALVPVHLPKHFISSRVWYAIRNNLPCGLDGSKYLPSGNCIRPINGAA